MLTWYETLQSSDSRGSDIPKRFLANNHVIGDVIQASTVMLSFSRELLEKNKGRK